ncbi:MAG: hypothetical protein U9R02_13415 [Thermodesulfobacteriota bacterium]|nr:hypothetical protein [Thermodesulfobacteriota bacterium]
MLDIHAFSRLVSRAPQHLKLRTYSLPNPKLSGFLLDLRQSLAHKGFAKILDISTGMPACPVECEAYSSGAVFANPYASRSQHISSQKIAQLRY